MNETKKAKISKKITSLCVNVIGEEFKEEITDRLSMEKYYSDLAEILCNPLTTLIDAILTYSQG